MIDRRDHREAVGDSQFLPVSSPARISFRGPAWLARILPCTIVPLLQQESQERGSLARSQSHKLHNLTRCGDKTGQCPESGEKRNGISYPIANESKTGASGGPRKGGYADERRISHWARVDHGRPGVVP